MKLDYEGMGRDLYAMADRAYWRWVTSREIRPELMRFRNECIAFAEECAFEAVCR